jgi:hypothetical protein
VQQIGVVVFFFFQKKKQKALVRFPENIPTPNSAKPIQGVWGMSQKTTAMIV